MKETNTIHFHLSPESRASLVWRLTWQAKAVLWWWLTQRDVSEMRAEYITHHMHQVPTGSTGNWEKSTALQSFMTTSGQWDLEKSFQANTSLQPRPETGPGMALAPQTSTISTYLIKAAVFLLESCKEKQRKHKLDANWTDSRISLKSIKKYKHTRHHIPENKSDCYITRVLYLKPVIQRKKLHKSFVPSKWH